MARGHPDYVKSVGYTPEGQFLQEYSIPPVWFEDNFEFPICKWLAVVGTATINTSFVIGAGTYYPYSGSSMMVCTSAVGGIFQDQRLIGTPPQTSNLGFSTMFLFSAKADWLNANNALQLINISFWTGATLDTPNISYNPRDGNWYYSSATLGLQLIENFDINELSWHYVKLIINPILKQYVSLQVDWRVFSLSGLTYRATALVAAERYQTQILGRADATDTVYLLVDNNKITYGET